MERTCWLRRRAGQSGRLAAAATLAMVTVLLFAGDAFAAPIITGVEGQVVTTSSLDFGFTSFAGQTDCSAWVATPSLVTISWGDGTTSSASAVTDNGTFCSVSGSHTYLDENDSFPLQLLVTDPTNAANVATVALGRASIGDADTATFGQLAITGVEGASFSGTIVTFTDSYAAEVASDLSATITWGDGSSSAGTVSGSGGSFTVSGAHTYAEEGLYSLKVDIDDDGALVGSATGTATIDDAALTAIGKTLTKLPGVAFTAVVASFVDADPAGTASDYSAVIDWGDGSTLSSGTISANSTGGFDVSGTHTYASTGSYAPAVTIVDSGGATTTVAATVQLPRADLGVSVGATPNPVKTRGTLTYKIGLSNAGPSAASNVVLNDALSAGTQFVSISATGFSCTTPAVGTSGTVTCRQSSLSAGGSATITLVVKVVAGGKTSVSNMATVSSDTFDDNTANNTATATTSVFGRQ